MRDKRVAPTDSKNPGILKMPQVGRHSPEYWRGAAAALTLVIHYEYGPEHVEKMLAEAHRKLERP